MSLPRYAPGTMTVSDGSMYLSDCVKRKSVDYVMETLDMIVSRVNPAGVRMESMIIRSIYSILIYDIIK